MKMTLRIILIILVLIPILANAESEKRTITVDDFFDIKDVDDPQISPDEKWVAYTVTQQDLEKDESETSIWMTALNGGEAIPMTAKGYSTSNPRWSPDGKYLSFLAQRSESGEEKLDGVVKTQVWALNRLGGEAQQLTRIKQGVNDYAWSPDGKKLLLQIKDPKSFELTEDKEDDNKARPFVIDRLQFKLDEEGYLDRYRNHLYIFTLGAEESLSQITSGDFDDSQAVWSPDGKSIAFVSNRTEEPDGNFNSDIWTVSANNLDKGATLLQLTHNQREDYSPIWSADGQSIAYITITADPKMIWYATNKLAVISSKGGKPTLLTAKLDRNIDQPRFSGDGKSLMFLIEDSGQVNLASVPVNGGKITQKINGKMSVKNYAAKGKSIAAIIDKLDQPKEIYTLVSGKTRQLTHTNDQLISQLSIAKTEKIQYKSKDGTMIEAFLTKPLGFNSSMKYPMILNPHGGPVSQEDYHFSDWAQLWAANGYLVLKPNPRGSSGRGQDFSAAISADWGHLDYQDVIAGVDYVIDLGYADPNRLGVGGWSYGGILTNYVITQTTRFKAAISGASETLFRANYGHDEYQLFWELELGLPWENSEAWERISPFNNVAKITTPTLWIGGASDWNVPIINSELMYQSMKRLGRETQLVVYPDEHHGIQRPSFNKDRMQRLVSWFDKYLKGAE